MTVIERRAILRYLYKRPTDSQAMVELLKEHIRDVEPDHGAKLDDLLALAREQVATEIRDRSST